MERIPQPIMDKRGEPHMKRFEDQRWVLDNIVRANGIDWDQPRSLYLNGPCGNEANADFAGIRERVKKMADIGPAFEAVACVKAIETGIVPPTIGLDDPDPECDLDYVPRAARDKKLSYAMSNSFGLGAMDASVIFGAAP